MYIYICNCVCMYVIFFPCLNLVEIYTFNFHLTIFLVLEMDTYVLACIFGLLNLTFIYVIRYNVFPLDFIFKVVMSFILILFGKD